MNNVFKDYDVGIRFDLKGSTQGRRTLHIGDSLYKAEADVKIALKDLDFIDHVKKIKFLMPANSGKQKLEDILTKDAQFFADTNILDYSLLLGRLKNPEEIFDKVVSGEIKEASIYFSEDGQAYIAGVIDILTEYNGKKRMEYLYKRIKYGKTMSCLPPD